LKLETYLEKRAAGDNPLAALLRLPAGERARLGVEHTAREIMQQPWAWRETARIVFRQAAVVREFFQRDDGVTGLVLTGAGSSAYAGLALAPLFRQVCGCAASAVPTTDLLLDIRGAFLPGGRSPSRSLLVSLARSGDSPESTAVVDRLLRELPEVRHLVLCSNGNGALARRYRECPNVLTLILPEATNDRSLVMTSSFSSLVVAGQCVAACSTGFQCRGDRRRGDSPSVLGRSPSRATTRGRPYIGGYQAMLASMVEAGEALLDASAVAEDLAAAAPERVGLLASPALFGMAREGALKLLESTAGGVATLAETFLGFRHGPMTFANDRAALLFFFSSDAATRKYELDLAREVRAKKLGMRSIGLGPVEEPGCLDASLASAYRQPIPDVYRAPLDVIFPQMLALFSSLRLGLRPDAPSASGVIHRVVEGVKIHDQAK
jgi:tagatose-6-phosphate ketose/aldose isomerase